jgi:hypothetical protein
MNILKIKDYLNAQFIPTHVLADGYITTAMRFKDKKYFTALDSFSKYKKKEPEETMFLDIYIERFHQNHRTVTLSTIRTYIRYYGTGLGNYSKEILESIDVDINDVESLIKQYDSLWSSTLEKQN